MGLVSGLEILRGLCVGKTDPIKYESGMSIFIAFLSLTGPVGSLLSSLTFIDGIPDFGYRIYATSETTWEVNLEERHRGEALKTHPASQHWGGCVTPRRFRYHHESNSEMLALRDNESLSSRPWTSLRSVKMCRAKALPWLGFASQPCSLARSAKTLP